MNSKALVYASNDGYAWLLGGVQLLFLGLLGEYILNINTRVIKRPVVVEEKRINFDEKE